MKLIDFFGQECPHCKRMMPQIDRLSEEKDIEIEKIEVWHDDENAKKMAEYRSEILEACGGAYGVPALVEPSSREVLCGEADYHRLHEWFDSIGKE